MTICSAISTSLVFLLRRVLCTAQPIVPAFYLTHDMNPRATFFAALPAPLLIPRHCLHCIHVAHVVHVVAEQRLWSRAGNLGPGQLHQRKAGAGCSACESCVQCMLQRQQKLSLRAAPHEVACQKNVRNATLFANGEPHDAVVVRALHQSHEGAVIRAVCKAGLWCIRLCRCCRSAERPG